MFKEKTSGRRGGGRKGDNIGKRKKSGSATNNRNGMGRARSLGSEKREGRSEKTLKRKWKKFNTRRKSCRDRAGAVSPEGSETNAWRVGEPEKPSLPIESGKEINGGRVRGLEVNGNGSEVVLYWRGRVLLQGRSKRVVKPLL